MFGCSSHVCIALCVSVVAARSSQPAERRDSDLHGDRPVHVHVAPRTIPQARQQKGKVADVTISSSSAHNEVCTELKLTAICATASLSNVSPLLKQYWILNCSWDLDTYRSGNRYI